MPAKSTVLVCSAVLPEPEPIGLYVTVTPLLAPWKPLIAASLNVFWNDEPAPLSVPDPPPPGVVGAAGRVWLAAAAARGEQHRQSDDDYYEHT